MLSFVLALGLWKEERRAVCGISEPGRKVKYKATETTSKLQMSSGLNDNMSLAAET